MILDSHFKFVIDHVSGDSGLTSLHRWNAGSFPLSSLLLFTLIVSLHRFPSENSWFGSSSDILSSVSHLLQCYWSGLKNTQASPSCLSSKKISHVRAESWGKSLFSSDFIKVFFLNKKPLNQAREKHGEILFCSDVLLMHGFSRALSWKFVKIPCWRISEVWERWMKALLCLYNSRSLGELIYIICPIVSILLYSHLVFTLLRMRTRSSSRDWSIEGTDYASGQDYYFHFRFHALHGCLLCSIRLQVWRTTWDLYRKLSTLYTTGIHIHTHDTFFFF